DYEEDWSAVSHIDEPDELRSELEKTIGRVIQSKSAVAVKPEEITSQLLAKNTAAPLPDPLPKPSAGVTASSSKKTPIVFDSTAEFYKSIGIGFQEIMKKNAQYNQFLLNQYKLQTGEANDDNEDATPTPTRLPYKEEVEEEYQKMDYDSDDDLKYGGVKSESSNRWHTVGDDLPNSSTRSQSKSTVKTPGSVNIIKPENPDIQGVLDDEPRLDVGVFSALKLAEKKGYIEKEKEKRYVDELGRDLSAKEAFRQLSHKFHGKGSGKNKTQKRMKKIKEEFLLKASTSSDTPLGTVNKLNKKLEAISMPYVILSGKNAAV
ncbi:unnamed protein product, partial [Trichobilharzia regenti]